MLIFLSLYAGHDRYVLRLPLWVAPGLDLELQLLTVPRSICFSQILFIWLVPGTLTPGNLSLNFCRISDLNFFFPFSLWYSNARKFLWAIVNCGRGGMVDWYLTFLEVLELNLTIFSHLLSFSWIWRFAIVIILSFKLIEFIINMADRDGVKMCAMSDWWCLTIPLLIGCRQQCRLLILHSAEWCQPAVPAWQLYRIKRRSVFCL